MAEHHWHRLTAARAGARRSAGAPPARIDGAARAAPRRSAAPERTRQILQQQDTVMHACEGETSMVMAVAPDLVQTDRLTDAQGIAAALVGRTP